MISWAPQQQEAIQSVSEWLMNVEREGIDNAGKVYRLFGYAGTGKSTLAQHIGQIEREANGYVQYAAFTGKAAMVLRRKGCDNARTIHSLIYTTHEKSQDKLRELEDKLKTIVAHKGAEHAEARSLEGDITLERERLQQPGFDLKQDALTLRDETGEATGERISLFIIDEVSMVDSRLGSDLLSYGAPVLALGDPAQLPPVGGGGYFTAAEPDFLLTQIHRQAADNPIIALATDVRNGKKLELGRYGESRVCSKADMTPEEWLAADQILVGRNNTRTNINNRVRALKGYEGFLPCEGEKLVCLRNNRDDGLLNGSLWECLKAVDCPEEDTFALRVRSLDGDGRVVTSQVHKAAFMGEKLEDWGDRMRANEFDYGYALTVHKSQGSQWENVLLFDEWNQKGRQEWLYTGITRAASRITVVRP